MAREGARLAVADRNRAGGRRVSLGELGGGDALLHRDGCHSKAPNRLEYLARYREDISARSKVLVHSAGVGRHRQRSRIRRPRNGDASTRSISTPSSMERRRPCLLMRRHPAGLDRDPFLDFRVLSRRATLRLTIRARLRFGICRNPSRCIARGRVMASLLLGAPDLHRHAHGPGHVRLTGWPRGGARKARPANPARQASGRPTM